jgi:hypothetical protein
VDAGGGPDGVVMAYGAGEEIPQAQVAPVPYGSKPGVSAGQNAGVAPGGRGGMTGEFAPARAVAFAGKGGLGAD